MIDDVPPTDEKPTTDELLAKLRTFSVSQWQLQLGRYDVIDLVETMDKLFQLLDNGGNLPTDWKGCK